MAETAPERYRKPRRDTNSAPGHELRFLSEITRWDTDSDSEAAYGLSRYSLEGLGGAPAPGDRGASS